MVPDSQLGSDLLTNHLANYSLIVPDQCHDMHGTGGCPDTNGLIANGDQYVGNTVNEVMSSPTWRQGNNAIVVTWDEDDYSDQGATGTGCCGFDPGGGHVVTIVITNHDFRPSDRQHPLQPLLAAEDHGERLRAALPGPRLRQRRADDDTAVRRPRPRPLLTHLSPAGSTSLWRRAGLRSRPAAV